MSKKLFISAVKAVWVGVAASALLSAGATVNLTNNSKEPWHLRLSGGPPVGVAIRGQEHPRLIELKAGGEQPVFRLDPGQTATLHFQERKGQPLSVDLGLVDYAGTEGGQFRVESKPSGLSRIFSRLMGKGPEVVKPVAPKEPSKEAADEWAIHADYWGDPY